MHMLHKFACTNPNTGFVIYTNSQAEADFWLELGYMVSDKV